MQTNDFLALPTSWQVKTLGEVCEITMGQSPLGEKVIDKRKNAYSKAIEFHQGKIHFTDKFIAESEVVTTDIRKIAQKDSVLLCVRAPVGVINITQRQIAIGRGLCALNLKDSSNDFLYFYLLTLKNYFNQKATGSTFSAINLDTIKNTKIPLPPLDIQKRIVSKLDEAFARIDNGVKHLKSAQNNIAKYKQSLLKAAFSGTLTSESSLREVGTTSWQSTKPCHLKHSEVSQTLESTQHFTHPLAPSAREGENSTCHTEALQKAEVSQTLESCHTEGVARSISKNSNDRDISLSAKAQYDKLAVIASEQGERGNLSNKSVDCHSPNRLRNDDKSVDCHDLTSSNLAMTDKHSPSLAENAHLIPPPSAVDNFTRSPSLAEGARGWVDSRNDTLACHTEGVARSISKNSNGRDSSLTAFARNDKERDISLSAKAQYDNNGINPNLPQGWTIKTLGEIAQIKGGKRLPKDSKYAETATPYPYIRVTDFEKMSVNTTNLKYLTKEIQQKIKNYTISKDDVYISIAGSIGKVGTIPDELDNANLTENAAKIVHSMDKKYLAFYLNSAEVQSQIAFFTKATTQPKLALYRIENLKVKIPPLQTQKQIVEILEKHLTSADKTSEFIESALNKAKQLKSSLLKSAFEGKLV